jgi:hypothetical protein
MGVPVMKMRYSGASFSSKGQCLAWWREAVPRKFLRADTSMPPSQEVTMCWDCDTLDGELCQTAYSTENPQGSNMGYYPWGQGLLYFCGCMPQNPGGGTPPSTMRGSSGYCSYGPLERATADDPPSFNSSYGCPYEFGIGELTSGEARGTASLEVEIMAVAYYPNQVQRSLALF